MKFLLATLAVLASLARADLATQAGRTVWGDSVKWGDSDDSTSYYRFRGNTMARDSASTWVTTTDSCSRPVPIGRGSQHPAGKLELSYEVRASSGNTDSTQVKFRIDSRNCLNERSSAGCESWVPASRFKGDSLAFITDSLISVATADGTTWKPTRQIFDVPGGNQIRLCVDSYQAGGATGDTTFFRRHIVRTSSIPSGGVPPGGGSSGSTDTELPSAAALADATANPTTTGAAGYGMVFNGTTWDRAPGTAASGAEVQGPVAAGSAAAGNPTRPGAVAATADPTPESAADIMDPLHTDLGKQVIMPYALPGLRWSYAAASGGITNTTAVTVKAAAGANIKNCVTSIQVINGHATVSTETLLVDGAGGTVLHRGFAQAAGGGYAIEFPVPVCGTANTLLEVDNVTTGSAVYYNLQGYTARE